MPFAGTTVTFKRSADSEGEIGIVQSYSDGKYQIKVQDGDNVGEVEVGEASVDELKLAPAQNRLFGTYGV
ncbi:hypothetical protein TWF281_004542 [Arthrobotrys megalospora]